MYIHKVNIDTILTVRMTRWKKDETEFTVGLFVDKSRGSMCVVPKPIVDMLGEPDSLKFRIKNKDILVTVGESKPSTNRTDVKPRGQG